MAKRLVSVLFVFAFAAAALAQTADLSVTGSGSPGTIRPGDQVTYSYTFTNNGPNAATNPSIAISPVGGTITYVSSSAPAGWTCGPFFSSYLCSASTLAASASANFSFVLQINRAPSFADGTVDVTTNVTSSTTDPNSSNNAVTTTTNVDSYDVDMVITMTDSPDPVRPGQNLTYTLQVTNNGPDVAHNVQTYGGNFVGCITYVSSSAPAGWTCTYLGNAVACSTPTMNSGASATITMTGRVDCGSSSGDFSTSTSAMVSSNDHETNSANNSDGESTNIDAYESELAVTMTDAPDPVHSGENLVYSVSVTNNGPEDASSVNLVVGSWIGDLEYVSYTAPAGWTCVYGGNPVSCSNSTLAVGATANFTFTGHVVRSPQAADSTYTGTATVYSNNRDANSANNSTSTTTAFDSPQADLTFSVADSPDPVDPGANLTYTGTLINNGPDASPQPRMVIALDSKLTFVSISAPAFTCTTPAVGSGGIIDCVSAGTLASGSSLPFTLVTKVVNLFSSGTIGTNFVPSGQSNDPDPSSTPVFTTHTGAPVQTADLYVTKTTPSNKVNPNTNVTYTLTIGNNGPDASASPVLSDTLPASLLFQSISSVAGWSCTTPAVGASGAITCTSASLASGASATFTLVAKTAANATGSIPNSAGGSDSTNDSNGSNDNATATISIASADLSVTKTTTSTTAAPGSNITYTITATNAGPDSATNATMTDALPASLLFQSISTPSGWSCTTPAAGATGTITCTNASMAAGSATFTLVVKVANSASGNITNSAGVSSATSDPNGGNSSGSAPVVGVSASADLSIAKTTTATTATPGSNITYTIAMSNAGPSAATNATMTDTLPAALRFQSISTPAGWSCTTPAVGATGTITCTNPSFAAGTNATFTLVAQVAVGTTGTVSNSASASSSVSDPNGSNSSSAAATPTTTADLTLTKTTAATTATPGSNLTYTLTLHNNGPDAAANAVLTDALPSSLRFQSISAVAGFTCTTPAVGSTGTITCTNASFASGATATFTLVVQVAPGTTGNVANTATATSAASDPSPASGSSSVPVASADLSITKSTAAGSAVAGGALTYTISMSNAGPNAATNATMTDVLPASLRFTSITTPSGFSCTTPAVGANGTITCTNPSFASGATATFTLVVSVANNATGPIANTATAASGTPDPDNGDTTSSTNTPLAAATPDVSITKIASGTTFPTGSNVTYTLNVSNAGPGTATGVVVTESLPEGLNLVSATPSSGTCSGTRPVVCTIGTLGSGASATISVVANVVATSGSIMNTASVATTTADPNNANNTATATITIGAAQTAPIPTLSEWALIGLAMLLGGIAVLKMRT